MKTSLSLSLEIALIIIHLIGQFSNLQIQCSLHFILLTAWHNKPPTSYQQIINIEKIYGGERAERATLDNLFIHSQSLYDYIMIFFIRPWNVGGMIICRPSHLKYWGIRNQHPWAPLLTSTEEKKASLYFQAGVLLAKRSSRQNYCLFSTNYIRFGGSITAPPSTSVSQGQCPPPPPRGVGLECFCFQHHDLIRKGRRKRPWEKKKSEFSLRELDEKKIYHTHSVTYIWGLGGGGAKPSQRVGPQGC